MSSVQGENGRFPLEVRLWAVEQIRAGVAVREVAQQIGVGVSQVYRWKKNPEHPDRKRNLRPAEELTPQGETTAGQAGFGGEGPGTGFSQRCLAKNRGSTPEEHKLWRDDIYGEIQAMMSRQGTLTIERMCQLGQVSRAGYYRFLEQSQTTEAGVAEEMELRSLIQQIALFHRRRYGYRRITRELHDRGYQVNHKRVLPLMQEDNLLCLRRRKFVVTTDSQHQLPVAFNLADG